VGELRWTVIPWPISLALIRAALFTHQRQAETVEEVMESRDLGA